MGGCFLVQFKLLMPNAYHIVIEKYLNAYDECCNALSTDTQYKWFSRKTVTCVCSIKLGIQGVFSALILA